MKSIKETDGDDETDVLLGFFSKLDKVTGLD